MRKWYDHESFDLIFSGWNGVMINLEYSIISSAIGFILLYGVFVFFFVVIDSPWSHLRLDITDALLPVTCLRSLHHFKIWVQIQNEKIFLTVQGWPMQRNTEFWIFMGKEGWKLGDVQ